MLGVEATDLRVGVYRHRSGGLYQLLGVGRFDEDDEAVVVYVRLYEHPAGGSPLCVRRLASWTETVLWPDDRRRPRFEWFGSGTPAAATGVEP